MLIMSTWLLASKKCKQRSLASAYKVPYMHNLHRHLSFIWYNYVYCITEWKFCRSLVLPGGWRFNFTATVEGLDVFAALHYNEICLNICFEFEKRRWNTSIRQTELNKEYGCQRSLFSCMVHLWNLADEAKLLLGLCSSALQPHMLNRE